MLGTKIQGDTAITKSADSQVCVTELAIRACFTDWVIKVILFAGISIMRKKVTLHKSSHIIIKN